MEREQDDSRGRRRVYLVRHAEVSYFNGEGKPVDPRKVTLTATGMAQAEAMADALADVPLDRVICSGLPRTRRTAELVLRGRSLPIEDIEAFREIRAGRLRDIAPERWDAEFVYGFEAAHLDSATFAGGEAFAAFEDRVLPAFERLCAEPGWEQLLLVAHDGVNRLLLGWAAGAPRRGMGAFEQDMCCLNIIDVDLVGGQVVRRLIKALNVTPYNLTKLGMTQTSMEQISSAFGRVPRQDSEGGRDGPV